MSAKFIPISEIVSEFLDQYDKSTADEDKAWVIAYRGLEMMHFNVTAEPKTIRIPVQPNKTAILPPDYVQWHKIGVLNSKGELVTLVINDSLTKYRSDNANRLSLLTPDVETPDYSNYYLNYWNNGVYTPLYGVGYGIQDFGECTVDEKNNIVVLGLNFKYDSVILEYISCPEKDGDYMVDRRLREALIAFIAWKFKLGSMQEFYALFNEADRMMRPFSIQKFNQVIREGNKFCLKL